MISLIHKSIINVVIAPHGITDLIHSTNFNTTKQLLTFNSASLIGSTLLSHNNPILLDDLFYHLLCILDMICRILFIYQIIFLVHYY